MKLKIQAFGIVKDIFENSFTEIELNEGATIETLTTSLEVKFPRLKQLASYMIALNDEYASAGDVIETKDAIAIIPPVSGG